MAATHSPTVEYRRHLYELYAQSPEGDLTDLAQEAWRRCSVKPSKSVRRLARVRDYLRDPDRFSPFVDEVAIERALQFDWPVIERLTPLELETFFDRLADMSDPFDDIASSHIVPRSEGAGSNRGAGLGHGGRFDMNTTRRYRWLAGTDLRRDAVVAGVLRRRRARQAEAA